MGIPGLYGNWLSKDVAKAVLDGVPPFVSSFSFDLNGVFHDARKQVFGEGTDDPRILQAIANTDPGQIELEIHNAIEAIIMRMVQTTNPRDCLILAVDGVAPGAKLQQQRGRREKSARHMSPNEVFDRNAITPGTEFMIRLDNFIMRMIGRHRQILPPKVLYSSHLVPGEGEHKIMDYFRSGEVSDGPAAKEGGVHIVYGLDADLIMLSLLAPVDHIILARETVKQTVDIDRLKEYIMERGNRPTAIDDFVVMMYLIGNDFLPQSPSLEAMYQSITSLLDIYANSDYVLTLTDEQGRHEINWDHMKLFIQAIAARENEFLAALSVKPVAYPSRFLRAALRDGQFYPDVFRSNWYQNALGPKGPRDYVAALSQIIANYVPNDYDMMIDPFLAQTPITAISTVTPDRITGMAIDYMRTMAWTYLYYREGTAAVNHDWAYPYYHTPMLSDLAAVMQLVGTQILITEFEAHEGMLQFTALHQLIAVLPLKSRDLLPIELQPLFSYNSVLRDLLPNNFIVELDGKDRYRNKQGETIEPEGVAIIPLIDRRRIFDAVAQITFTPERAKLWMPATDEPFIRTAEQTEILARFEFDKQRKAQFDARQVEYARRAKARRDKFNQQQQGTGQFTQRQQGTGQFTQRQGTGQFTQRQQGTGQFTQRQGGGQFTQRQQGTGQFTQRQGGGQFTQRQPAQGITQQGGATPLVPTMTTNQGARSPGGGRGRGRGGGGRGGREGRTGQRDIRRAPTGTVQQQQPNTFNVNAREFVPTQMPTTQQPTQMPTTQQPTQQRPTPTRQGPTLTPIGTNIPTGLKVGKGPTLIPIGNTIPVNLPVGRGPTSPGIQNTVTPINPVTQPRQQVIPVNQTTQQTARSPAKWQQLPDLM